MIDFFRENLPYNKGVYYLQSRISGIRGALLYYRFKDWLGSMRILGKFTSILDQSGKALLFGAKKEKGGIGDLMGDNKLNLFKVDMKVKFDANGNFTGVSQGKKNYTVEQWNEKIEKTFK